MGLAKVIQPKSEQDQEKIRRMRVKDIGFHDRPPQEAEQEELIPELGRFSAMAIPPAKENPPEYSRFDAERVRADD